ncbi:MAG TPA: hypothetical protein PLY56_02215 [Armatimonadota bacterium]|jgi:hypothetical protein|nr:hypothetical protein [Armatimonadota bacterium]HOJ20324.1 hypothetical protein [Armatimonadota bacterium]HOM82933.1 hypothetical protein [Armatimonadota bacterium]HPO73220.1 hypothetical protein [Armatimonadota bacterium]
MSLDDWLQSGSWMTRPAGLGEAAGKLLEHLGGSYEKGRRAARAAKQEGKRLLEDASEKCGVSEHVEAAKRRAEAARERAATAAETALRFIKERPAARIARAGVQIKAGLTGFGAGYLFPDVEVLFLGASGRGRWLTQSGIPVWGAEKVVRSLLLEREPAGGDDSQARFNVRRELYGAVAAPLLAGMSAGLGLRLTLDALSVRGVQGVGQLIVGGREMLFERIWMLGNGVWCFLMGKDLLLVTLGRSKNQTLSDVLQRLRDGDEDEEEPV